MKIVRKAGFSHTVRSDKADEVGNAAFEHVVL